MWKSLIVLLIPALLAAKVHYAKVEPYETITLKAAASGQVVNVNIDAEGTLVKNSRVIHIDDKLNRIDLNDTKESLVLLEQMLGINQEIADSLAETVKRQEGYYHRISKLATASKTQKDNAYSAFASAKTQYLGIKEKIASLKKQILDMRYKIDMLKDTIAKKSIVLHDRYLDKLLVKEGEYVAPGSPLARINNMTQAKLVLFLEPEELPGIKQKHVFLNGKATTYHVNKVWHVTDEKYISSYRAEIYLSAPKAYFSKLMKVELK